MTINATDTQVVTTPPTNVAPIDGTTAAEVKTQDISSGFDYLDSLPGLVEGMRTNVIDNYVNAMQGYQACIADLAGLRATLTNAISNVDNDPNWINIDGDKIRAAINNILGKYDPDGALYVCKQTGDAGRAEAERWAREFGLDPDASVRHGAEPGTFQVCIDLSSLRNMYDSVVSGKVNAYQEKSMMDSIDMNMQNMTYKVQVLGEKYGQMYSSFNSLNQMVTNSTAERSKRLADMW